VSLDSLWRCVERNLATTNLQRSWAAAHHFAVVHASWQCTLTSPGTCVVAVAWRAPGEGSPAEVKQEVEKRRAGKSNVCGRIWKNGDMAYKCRNCGYDEPWYTHAHLFFTRACSLAHLIFFLFLSFFPHIALCALSASRRETTRDTTVRAARATNTFDAHARLWRPFSPSEVVMHAKCSCCLLPCTDLLIQVAGGCCTRALRFV
jgi:hypothetical protein